MGVRFHFLGNTKVIEAYILSFQMFEMFFSKNFQTRTFSKRDWQSVP